MTANRKRKTAFSGAFAGRLVEMLEGPAYRVLSLSAHRALARIEIEFGHHGGKENGRLVVTFDQFGAYGIDRTSIASALRELEALGFIEVTERGCAGNAEARKPNMFRLTYRAHDGVLSDGTHEWRRIKTLAEAKALADAARKAVTGRIYRVSQKQKPSMGKPTMPSMGKPH